MRRHPLSLVLAFALAPLGLAACAGTEPVDGGLSGASQWAAARALWHIDRDPAAYRAWIEIDPATPEGREAHRLLAEAEPHYRRGIERVRGGDPEARESFERAVRIAPMDPVLYLPLARAFRDQGRADTDNPHLFIRAAEYYRKFIALVPHDPRTEEARAELAEIDPEGSRLFAPPGEVGEAASQPLPAPQEVATWPLWVAVAALALAVAAIGLLLWRSRERLESLDSLAERKPELHPAIHYLVSSLRHELLKHRIGAVGSAVDALREGRASEAQIEFLRGRLYGGEPLTDAWHGHLAAFRRALGPELDLHRADKHFRAGGRAIEAIAKLEKRLAAGDARAFEKLSTAHATLRELDKRLGQLAQRLVRTSVDGALFRDVVDAVRGEYAAGAVQLDEVVIRSPEPAPFVEVFRVDLVLVLKNVVRNAILAVASEEPPRRIGLDVDTHVELTGEETVRIHVRDTCPQELTTEDIYARRMSRGLGLVTAALSRYDGAIQVEPADGEWAKSVVVRFFRAYDEE
ncbi:MAG: hypothetical protein H6719_17215 [Sandaracinaceae bacterium]|nr:hypothetical protein [Sandaracinaceae bacterium]